MTTRIVIKNDGPEQVRVGGNFRSFTVKAKDEAVFYVGHGCGLELCEIGGKTSE